MSYKPLFQDVFFTTDYNNIKVTSFLEVIKIKKLLVFIYYIFLC
ncbi:hypothetical protein HMPREF0083_02949 [Aneurinibacillus aneurinilyticus ATCC 12856]|uniref:Uncharacterized protein n=1 Tax=Aneurinibacillus aneurinilyticus ATCC 12856 TaxID=649747 RepID=U1YDU5_ANEAE|nr:hypothetical protein HMPREF0083_02949 [Aneurinibacillus aneurinilyticus ATCC 12856]